MINNKEYLFLFLCLTLINAYLSTPYLSKYFSKVWSQFNPPPISKMSQDPTFSFCPASILNDNIFNKGTAFPMEEREKFKLRGLLPPVIEDIDHQSKRARIQMDTFDTPINKYVYLNALQRTNIVLFYHFLMDNIEDCLPIVYTPTVGETCQKLSQLVRGSQGMYLDYWNDKGCVRSILDNWRSDEVDIIVVTDGSRILGLGDLGVNGMGIPIGKLSLYVAAAGLHPARTLPITLDVGTNSEHNHNDPFYIGQKKKRVSDEEFFDFTNEFAKAVKDKWPNCLVQWEDFSTDHAFTLLDNHRESLLSFNDDIQGTGAVVLAGFIAATRLMKLDWKQHKLVFLGAGSAGVGIAEMMVQYLISKGLTDEEARGAFYLVDSKGLITNNRGDTLADHKVAFARKDMDKQIDNLKDVVEYVKPTCLLGLSTIHGAFTEEILKMMGSYHDMPFILPLSNPTSKAECTAEQAYKFTNGKCIFAAGSPFKPVEYNGKTFTPGQGNNLYIFPGLGLGALVAKSSIVTDKMIMAAAENLASQVTDEEFAKGLVYPSLKRIRKISHNIAVAVAKESVDAGVADSSFSKDTNFDDLVSEMMWWPEYTNLKVHKDVDI